MGLRRVGVRRHLRRKPISRVQVKPKQIDSPYSVRTKAGNVYIRFSGEGGGGEGGEPLGGYHGEGLEYRIGQDTLRENSMDNLDELLGFDVVPETHIRATDIDAENLYGSPSRPPDRAKLAISIQAEVPNAANLADVVDSGAYQRLVGQAKFNDTPENVREEFYKHAKKDDLIKIAVLDFISLNEDRHGFNVVIDQKTKHAYGIDHELTFEPLEVGYQKKRRGLYNVRSIPWKVVQGEEVPRAVREAIRGVTKGDFYAALAGLPIDVIDGAWARKRQADNWVHVPDYVGWD